MIELSPSELALFKHRANLSEFRSEHAIVRRYNTPEPNRWSDFHNRMLLVRASSLPTDTDLDTINLTLKTYKK